MVVALVIGAAVVGTKVYHDRKKKKKAAAAAAATASRLAAANNGKSEDPVHSEYVFSPSYDSSIVDPAAPPPPYDFQHSNELENLSRPEKSSPPGEEQLMHTAQQTSYESQGRLDTLPSYGDGVDEEDASEEEKGEREVRLLPEPLFSRQALQPGDYEEQESADSGLPPPIPPRSSARGLVEGREGI